MKVAIVSNLEGYGGVQSCVLTLARALNDEGIVPVLITDRSVNTQIIAEQRVSVDVIAIKYSLSSSLVSFAGGLLFGARDLVYHFRTSKIPVRFDFLYVFHPNVMVDCGSKHLYYLSMSPRAIGFSGQRFRSWLKFIAYDLLLKWIVPVYEFGTEDRQCVINSRFTEAMFSASYGRSLKVVYPPAKVESLMSTVEQTAASRETVLFFSRIAPAKRPEVILNLAERFPLVHFVIMGAVECEEYLRAIASEIKSRMLVNVQLKPNVATKVVSEELSKCKIYIFPAINEHFGITTVEAMACGAIPLVHDSGGQREIVPWPELRFSGDDLEIKFRNLIEASIEEVNSLQLRGWDHVKKFDERVYGGSMISYLPVVNAGG